MLIRLIPPAPHPTILYGLTFPHVLSLHDLGPSATIPAAWSSQLHILTSILQLEPPLSIHMLDRAVGLVARVHEVTMDVPQKEFVLRFIDGRVINIPMNSDCIQILLGVVVDVKGCSEPESQRNSMEGACPGSADDHPSGGSLTRSAKLGKHKRQRSFLFSLISSLVPKSLSSSPVPAPPPSTAPPPAPLPPLPVSGRVTSPISPLQTSFLSEQPDLLRRRARAALVDVWRRHVLSALALQHLPAAGYVEWTLIAMAGKVRAEIESFEIANSHSPSVNSTRVGRIRHRKSQSEGRNALDFGDRSDDCGSEQWRCRAPSPFPGVLHVEDTDRVVYPRREQADEWGVRYVHHSRSTDQVGVLAVEYNGHNDSLLGEHFAVGDDWDDTERLTFELSRKGHHDTPDADDHLHDEHLHPVDFGLDCSDDNESRQADTAFDVSGCPLTPSDVNNDEQSNDSQVFLRTPEDVESLPLASPRQILQGLTQDATCAAPQPPLVSRVNSSRPRSRNASAQFSSAPSRPPTPPPSGLHDFDYKNTQLDDFMTSRIAYMERICAALEMVRSRAREEGWRLVRATLIGEENGWMDAEAERALEIKAKRRAWSSGIKISAPYSTSRSASMVWDSSFLTFRSPIRPPGLTSSSKGILQVRGPIVPTGLALGIPVRSSPLAMYAWGVDDGRKPTSSKYGILNSEHSMETIGGKRSSRVAFADNVVKLFPVCEDEGEELLEHVQVGAVGFPQAVPPTAAEEERECSLSEEAAGREEDPFYLCPSRPRMRTSSMYMTCTSSTSSSPVLPMFRPSTPPPSYQAAVGGDIPTTRSNEEMERDASVLLLQPHSSLCISSSVPSSRSPLISNPPIVPRPRAVSLPTPKDYSSTNKTRRTSFHHKDEHCEDLSQTYAMPPPEGPLVISATPAPHEQYPRYAHVHSPIPACKKSMNASILGRTGKEVVFEQAGSEFTVGIEVALGRAEEGRVVW